MADLNVGIHVEDFKKKIADLKKELLDLAGQADQVTEKSVKKIDSTIQKQSKESSTKAVQYIQKSFDSLYRVQKQLDQYQSASSKVHEQFYMDIKKSAQGFAQAARQIQYSLDSINFVSVRKNIAKLQSDMSDWQKKNIISQPYTTSVITPLDNLLKQVNKFIGNRSQSLLVRLEDINTKALSPLLSQIKKTALNSAVSEPQKKFFKWQMDEMVKALSSIKKMPSFQIAGQSFLDLDSFGSKAMLPFFRDIVAAIKQVSKESDVKEQWSKWKQTIRDGINSYYSDYQKSGQNALPYNQFVESVLARALKAVGYDNAHLLKEITTASESQILDKLLTKLTKADFYPDPNIQRSSIYTDSMKGGFEVGRMWVKEAKIQSFTPATPLLDYSAIPTNIDISKPNTAKINQYIKSFSDYFDDIRNIVFTNLETGLKSFTETRGLAGLKQINTVLDYGKKLFYALPMFEEVSEQILALSHEDSDLSPQQLNKFKRANKNLYNILQEAYRTSSLVPTLIASAKSYFDSSAQANIVTTGFSGEDFAQAATAKSIAIMMKDLFQKGAKSIFFKAIQNISTTEIFPLDTEHSMHIARALEYLNLQISKYSGSWGESLQKFLTDFNTNLLHDILLLADRGMLDNQFTPSDKQKAAVKMLGGLAGEAILANKRDLINELEHQLLKEYETNKAMRGLNEKNIGISSDDLKKKMHYHVPIVEWLKLVSDNFDVAIQHFNDDVLSKDLIPHPQAMKKYLMPENMKERISKLLSGVAQENIQSVIDGIHNATDKASKELSEAITKYGIPGIADRKNLIVAPVRKQIQAVLNHRLSEFEENSKSIAGFLDYVYDAWMKRFDDIELIDSLITKGYNAKQHKLGTDAEYETVLTDTMTGLAGISAPKTDVLREVADDVVYLIDKMNQGVIYDKDVIRIKAVEALEFLINNTYPEQIADGIEDAMRKSRLFKIGDSVKQIVSNGFVDTEMSDQEGRSIAQNMGDQFRSMLLHHIAQEFTGQAFSANKLQDIFEKLHSIAQIKNDITNQRDLDHILQALNHMKTLTSQTGQKRIEDTQKYIALMESQSEKEVQTLLPVEKINQQVVAIQDSVADIFDEPVMVTPSMDISAIEDQTTHVFDQLEQKSSETVRNAAAEIDRMVADAEAADFDNSVLKRANEKAINDLAESLYLQRDAMDTRIEALTLAKEASAKADIENLKTQHELFKILKVAEIDLYQQAQSELLKTNEGYRTGIEIAKTRLSINADANLEMAKDPIHQAKSIELAKNRLNIDNEAFSLAVKTNEQLLTNNATAKKFIESKASLQAAQDDSYQAEQIQNSINREKVAAETKRKIAQDAATQKIKIETEYYNQVNKLQKLYGDKKDFGLARDNIGTLLPDESFSAALGRLNELEAAYKKATEARRRLTEMGRDSSELDRRSDEEIQQWVNRLRYLEKYENMSEAQRMREQARHQERMKDASEGFKAGVADLKNKQDIKDAYDKAYPSGKRFWDGMAKAGMVMSGIAASIFVTQQAIMTFGQIMNVYTDIEKKVSSLGETYKWTSEQQALLTSAAKKIVKFSSVDSSEFIKSVGDAYKKGIKAIKFSSKKLPLQEVDLGTYIESEYQKALGKAMTIDSALQRVVNSFKGILIESIDSTNDVFIKNLVSFSDYINANSQSIQKFFNTLLDTLTKLGSTFALVGQLAGSMVSGLASGAGSLASTFDNIIDKTNYVLSLVSGFDNLIGSSVIGAGITYGILGRLFFGSWGPAKIIAMAVSGLTLATEIQEKAKALNNTGGNMVSGLIDIGISGASGYLGMSALQKMIPSITANLMKLAPTLVGSAAKLNLWTAAIAMAIEAVGLLTKATKDLPTQISPTVENDETFFYTGPEIEYGFDQLVDEEKLNEELKEVSNNISETIATNVIDGDTIRAALKDQNIDKELSEVIRFAFVNTAESVNEDLSKNTGEGLLAKAFMKGLIPDGAEIKKELFKAMDLTDSENGLSKLTDENGNVIDHYLRQIGIVFVNGVNANLTLIETGLSKYITKYGESSKYAEAFRSAEANIHPMIKDFYARMNAFMKENNLDMTISQKDDPMNFEKLKFATVAFGYELQLIKQKVDALKSGNYTIFNIDRLYKEAEAINQLKISVSLLMNSPEMQAMQRGALYSNYFDETYNKDQFLEKALTAAGHDIGEAQKFIQSIKTATTQRWIAEDKKMVESTQNYADQSKKTDLELLQSTLNLSKIKTTESERALNNVFKNEQSTQTIRQNALTNYKQQAAEEIKLQKQIVIEKYTIESTIAKKALDKQIDLWRELPEIEGKITKDQKETAIRLLEEDFKKKEQIRTVNRKTELEQIDQHQENINEKLNQSSEAITQREIKAQEKRTQAIQKAMEKNLKIYESNATKMVNGVTKLQDEITQAEGGTNEKKIQQLDRNLSIWTKTLDDLETGIKNKDFTIDMVKAILGGKTVDEFRSELQSAADGIRPIYQALDELEDIKKKLAGFSLDTSLPEFEQYNKIAEFQSEIRKMILEQVEKGTPTDSAIFKALLDDQEKWGEKSKSIYDKVKSEGKTAFNDLYKELQSLGENNLDFQLKVLDVEFMEKANSIANYMSIVEQASAEEILLVLDQLNRVKEARIRELYKTASEYEGFYGGIKAGLMDWQDDWITSQQEMGKASREFISSVRQELKDFFAESVKMSIKTLIDQDDFVDLSDEFDKVEAELEASAAARTSLIFTPEMEAAFTRMNQVQVDSSSAAYASQIDSAIKYYNEVERLATSEEDRMAAAYKAQYYEIEKQRLDDIADAGGDAAKIAEINAEANEEILSAKKDFVDEWYEYQLDTITELNDKTQDTYKDLFDAIGGFFKDMIDSIWDMFLDLIAKMIAQDIFNWVFGGSSGNGITINGSNASTSGSSTISSISSLVSLGKFVYNLPETIAALPTTIGNAFAAIESYFNPALYSEFSGAIAEGSATIASETAAIGTSATEAAAATGAAAETGAASMSSLGAAAGYAGAMFAAWYGVVKLFGGDFTNDTKSTIQILQEFEAGILSLTETQEDYYKTVYMDMASLAGVDRNSQEAMQNFFQDAQTNHETFTNLTIAQMDAIKAKSEELKTALANESGELAWLNTTMFDALNSETIRVELETLMMQFGIDPSDEWYDLVIQVDAPESIPVSYENTGGLATGGTALAGKPYWVGERGPELVFFNEEATVLNHMDSVQYAAAGNKIYGGYASGSATYPIEDFLSGDVTLNIMIEDASTHSNGTTELEMWEDLYTKTEEYLNLLTDVEKEIDDINKYYEEQIELAEYLYELGRVTTEELEDIYKMQAAALAQFTEDWVNETSDYIYEAMGWTSDLGDSLNEMNEYFQEAIINAIALGATSEDIEALYSAWNQINTQLIEDWASDYNKYVSEMMGTNSSLGDSIQEVNEQYEQFIKEAIAAGASQEQLNQMYAQQAVIIANLKAEYLDNLTQGFQNLRFELAKWAQSMTNGEIDAAINSLLIWRDMEGFSARNADDIFNFNGMDETAIEEYVGQLENLFSSIADTLKSAFENLKALQDDIAGSIEDLQLSGMSTQQQADFYLNRAATTDAGLDSMRNIEDQVAAAQQIHDDIMSYYDLEKQAIEEKYQTEIDAINDASDALTDMIEAIDAINDKIQSLKYSSYNVALPREKATEAAQDYATMLANAKAGIESGDTTAVNDLLGFVDTYLQTSQDAYKSSTKYQGIYNQVQADLESLGLSMDQKTAGKTVEELTEDQNKLIDDLNEQMQTEIDTLTERTITALDYLGKRTETLQENVVDALIKLYELIDTTEDLTRSTISQSSEDVTEAIDNLSSMSSMPVSDFDNLISSKGASAADDGTISLIEINTVGFVGVITAIQEFMKGVSDYWIAYNEADNARNQSLLSAINNQTNLMVNGIGNLAIGLGACLVTINSSIHSAASNAAVYLGSAVQSAASSIVAAINALDLSVTITNNISTIGTGGRDIEEKEALDKFFGGKTDIPRGFADGGWPVGPDTGYLATLHGQEVVLADPKAVRTGSNESDPEIKMLLRELVAATKAGKVIQIDGKPIAQIADKVTTDKFNRNQMGRRVF